VPTVQDARGVQVHLDRPPQRIVSLVPSTTETLFAFGLREAVVGVTRFCVYPEGPIAELTRVGGTKDLELDRLEALEPDLVVGNIEENTPAIFEAVEGRWPLYAAMPRTVDAALEDLSKLGRLVGAEAAASAWRGRAEAARSRLRQRAGELRWRYTYVIWREPWMVVSGDTFIASMLTEAGGINRYPTHPERYPTLTQAQLVEEPDARLLLSSEPFPFKDKHRRALCEAGAAPSRVHLIDGELCSWHGVRMADGFNYLSEMLPVFCT